MQIDTFTFLFKSNAKETEKDVKSLENTTDKVEKKFNDADKQASKLSDTLIDVGLKGLAAFASFEGLKSGITNAANFNAQLEKLHQTTGVNQKELAAYDATFAQFGANAGDFSNAFETIAKQVLLVNGNVDAIIPNIRALGKEMSDLEKQNPGRAGEDAARSLFERRNAQLGGALPDSLEYALLKDPDVFDKVLQQQEDLLDVTQQTTKAGLELQSAWKESGSVITASFTPAIEVATKLLQAVNWLGKAFNFLTKDLDEEYDDEQSGKVPTVPGSSSSGGKVPLGIRNNNPGNLRSWNGRSGADGFAHFGSLQEGLSAEDKQLALYGSRGINTLAAIASKWAPSSENNTAAYIAGISKSTGLGANQPLDMSNPATRKLIADAINQQENGASYGNLLLSHADNSPINPVTSSNNSSQSITISNITVNSQATDAKGISLDIQKSLIEQLSYLGANLNDGIAK